MSNITVLLGPPGCAKTHTLINICHEAIKKGISPQKIGFLAFTKKAAREAIERASLVFATEKDLPYFRTIHSLAYRSLGIHQNDVFSIKHLQEFSLQYGYTFSMGNVFSEDGTFLGKTEDSVSLFLANLAKNKCISLDELWSTLQDSDASISDVRRMRGHYTLFKAENHLIDFTDMLERYQSCDINKVPRLDLLCVDEAQDLSALQWKCIWPIIQKAKEVYIAGDDDQAIHEWAGADLKQFQDLCGAGSQVKWLSETYRFGKEIWIEAHNIARTIESRVNKPYAPHPKLNMVSEVFRSCELDDVYNHINSDQTTYILARSMYLLRPIIDFLEEDSLLSWSYTNYPKHTSIKIGTIHSVKGGQADNVVIVPDVPRTVADNLHTDAEKRVWYVAVTRAKKKLFLLEPNAKDGNYYEF